MLASISGSSGYPNGILAGADDDTFAAVVDEAFPESFAADVDDYCDHLPDNPRIPPNSAPRLRLLPIFPSLHPSGSFEIDFKINYFDHLPENPMVPLNSSRQAAATANSANVSSSALFEGCGRECEDMRCFPTQRRAPQNIRRNTSDARDTSFRRGL